MFATILNSRRHNDCSAGESRMVQIFYRGTCLRANRRLMHRSQVKEISTAKLTNEPIGVKLPRVKNVRYWCIQVPSVETPEWHEKRSIIVSKLISISMRHNPGLLIVSEI